MIQSLTPVLLPILLEAALRALLVGITVWSGLCLLRIGNVPAQKTAWGLVLAAALAIPLLMPLTARMPWFGMVASVRLPALPWNHLADSQQPAQAVASAIASDLPASVPAAKPARMSAAPPPVRRAARHSSSLPISSFVTGPNFNPQAQSATIVPPALHDFAAKPPAAPLRLPSPAKFAWLLYLAVCAALLLRLVFGLVSAARLWQTASPVSMNAESAQGLRVRSSRRVASPVTIGSGVVLPADYADWSVEKLRIVLAHERSHIRQGDFYLQLLAGFYTATFWFSPLGWWLKRKLSELAEAISDRAGLEEAASRSSYAQILLEFAALPRPTQIGVAMARTSNLSQRIERLLNDSTFRQAFAAGRGRALAAVLLVPAALFAATALVRVEAATPRADAGAASLQAQAASPAVSPQTPLAGHSDPDHPNDPAAAKASPVSPTPAAVPAATATPAVVLEPPTPPQPSPTPAPEPVAPVVVITPMPVPPLPRAPQVPQGPQAPQAVPAPQSAGLEPDDLMDFPGMHFKFKFNGKTYAFGDDEDNYAIVGDPGTKPRYFRNWEFGNNDFAAEIEKARKTAHGHFLWFRHDGKSYVIDDPAIVTQVEAMDKAMQDLGGQMKALGQQQRDIGKQQREEAQKAREASRNIPTPDLSKEMADLNAAVAELQANKNATISREQLQEIQRKVSEVQRRLITAQVKINMTDFNVNMAKFGEEQGKFGAEMGRMGAEMGRMARENDGKIQGFIKDSLTNGKARPVE